MDDKQFKLDLRYLRMAHIWAGPATARGDR